MFDYLSVSRAMASLSWFNVVNCAVRIITVVESSIKVCNWRTTLWALAGLSFICAWRGHSGRSVLLWHTAYLIALSLSRICFCTDSAAASEVWLVETKGKQYMNMLCNVCIRASVNNKKGSWAAGGARGNWIGNSLVQRHSVMSVGCGCSRRSRSFSPQGAIALQLLRSYFLTSTHVNCSAASTIIA